MPNEPGDNKMDELLRAYAQKRKADATGSFELHPATRRLFQTEVAKLRADGSEQRKSWLSALVGSWPRLAFGVGLIAVLGVALWRFIPAPEQPLGEQLLAKGESSDLARPVAVPLSPANKPPAEVAQTAAEAARPTNRKEDSDQLARARPVVSEKLVERREAGLAVSEAGPPPAAPLNDESKRKQSEASLFRSAFQREPAPVDLTDQWRQQKDEAELESAAVRPNPNRAAPVPTTAAKSTGAMVASAKVRASQTAAVPGGQRGPVATETSGAAAEDKFDGSVAFSYLGTFTNTGELAFDSFQFRDRSSSAQTGQNASSSAVNDRGMQGPGQAGRSDGEYIPGPNLPGLQSGQAQRNLQERSASLANNESQLRLLSNQVIRRQSSVEGKDAAASPTNSSIGIAKQKEAISPLPSRPALVGSELAREVGASPQSAAAGNIKTEGASVLAVFALEQSGQRVRVVDGDGSIYDGAVTSFEEAKVLMLKMEKSSPSARFSSQPGQQAIRGGTGGQGVIGFRVAGTNNTLKLPVVLEGAFLGEADLAGDMEKAGSKEGPPLSKATQERLAEVERRRSTSTAGAGDMAPNASVVRVTGQARVGETNEIRIDAVRSGQ